MAAISVNKLTNANVYLDGGSFLGQAMEVELPKITQVMAEHSALGMIAKFEIPSGVDKMEGKISWNSFYPAAMLKVADPTASVKMQVRASLETHTSDGRTAQVPCVAFMTVQFKEIPLGNYKQHENVELESALNVLAVRLEINSQPIVELDVFANIYKVNGVDIAATYRENIGQ